MVKHIKSRGGRPQGAITVPADMVIRRQVHLTVHKERTPLLAQWLTKHADRGLAGDLVDLMEKALAGRNVTLDVPVGEQVFEIDMSGLLEWD